VHGVGLAAVYTTELWATGVFGEHQLHGLFALGAEGGEAWIWIIRASLDHAGAQRSQSPMTADSGTVMGELDSLYVPESIEWAARGGHSR
jgi:hypothetical protein